MGGVSLWSKYVDLASPAQPGEFVSGGTFKIGEVSTSPGIPAIEFFDQIISFADIWSTESQQLLEMIAESKTMFQRARRLTPSFWSSKGTNLENHPFSQEQPTLFTPPVNILAQTSRLLNLVTILDT
ncbi:hypothetical protein LA52FAK_38660 [Desulforhopalus sp. 52FAK]